MADAKDILGLPKGPPSAAAAAAAAAAPAAVGASASVGAVADRRPKAPKDTPKKPDGVSREVYALTGGLPMMIPTSDISTIKKRPPSGADKISWRWLPFTSSARKDGLELYHWVKVVNGVQPAGDYAFAKYNKKVDVVRYTDEEYTKYLTDPNWTREQTDQLFDLCEQFDLRFIVIADRFTPTRSVEELKNRYYSAARAILLAKAPSPEEVADHPLVKEPYNIIPEVERKKALAAMYSQSRQQESDDIEVLAEVKPAVEARISMKSGDDAEVSVAGPTTIPSNVEIEKASTPVGSTSPSPAPQIPIAAPHLTLPSGSTGISTPAALRMAGVYLRTTLFGQLLQATVASSGIRTVKRVDQMLHDLGVNVKPKVPTKAVSAEHMELRKEIVALINVQKQCQSKEAELSALRDTAYGDFPLTSSTPKLQRSHRGGEHEKNHLRGFVGIDDGFSGERVGKRDHKRKAPTRFLEAPPSPQNKRARKKVSDG